MKNKQFALWLMGPSASGKTTVALNLLMRVREKGRLAIHYDGDEVRDFFGSDYGFSKRNRLNVVKTLVHLANKSTEAGINVIISALTANNDARKYVKKNVKNLIFVYVDCSIKTCVQRDPKGLYKKAINGEIDTLIGYNSEYEPLDNFHIKINTENYTCDDCVDRIITNLNDYGFNMK